MVRPTNNPSMFLYVFLMPLPYALLYICLNKVTWLWVESYVYNVEFIHKIPLSNKENVALAIIASVWVELMYLSCQLMLYIIMQNETLFNRWSIKKPHLQYPPNKLLNSAIFDIIISHLLRPFFFYMTLPFLAERGISFSASEFPHIKEIIFHFMGAMIVDDTLFYWFHRGLHESKYLYRTIHKKHHEFHYVVGLCTEYTHPIEDILSNLLPTLLGPYLLRSHISVMIGYIGLKLWQSIDAHSGLLLPFPLSPMNVLYGMDTAPAHDFHHSHNTGNYGGYFTFWDWICGTDLSYKKMKSKQQKQT